MAINSYIIQGYSKSEKMFTLLNLETPVINTISKVITIFDDRKVLKFCWLARLLQIFALRSQ
jgi:hypothetical protein